MLMCLNSLYPALKIELYTNDDIPNAVLNPKKESYACKKRTNKGVSFFSIFLYINISRGVAKC